MSRILIVEDEKHIADGLSFNLQAEGHRVEIASDGEQGLALLLGDRDCFDAVILDVMLPGKSGFDVAAELRQAGQFVPILMLTARGRPEDVLQGFAAGADDYLPKPFELAILLARLRGLLRRREWLQKSHPPVDEQRHSSPSRRRDDEFSFAGKTIDFGALELRVRDKTFRLTAMESELLRYLVRNPGTAISRKAILEDVWGLHEDTDTRAIDNFIVRLRRYIEDQPDQPRHLLTVRGVGYRFVSDPGMASTAKAVKNKR